MSRRSNNQLPDKQLYYDCITSPVGQLYVVMADDILTGVSFERPGTKRSKCPLNISKQFEEYFNGVLREFDVRTRFIDGTAFEREVWSVLKEISYGETRSYKWLAEKIGRPRAVRAVGQALKKNPLPIIFPCHRVIEADSSIGGYAPGVGIKRRLLDMEYYFGIND